VTIKTDLRASISTQTRIVRHISSPSRKLAGNDASTRLIPCVAYIRPKDDDRWERWTNIAAHPIQSLAVSRARELSRQNMYFWQRTVALFDSKNGPSSRHLRTCRPGIIYTTRLRTSFDDSTHPVSLSVMGGEVYSALDTTIL
jgi:hypothetical protein